MAELILGLDAPDYWIFVLALGLFAMFAYIGAFVLLSRARLMEDTPTARIRSAAQGYAELEGIARLLEGEPVVAPLTHKHCCWWQFKIERRERNSNGKGHHWRTIDSGSSEAIFRLIDDTGECVVDPQGAKVVPSLRHVWYGNSERPSQGPASSGGWLRRAFGNYRYTEEQLGVDLPLYAIGLFRTQGGVQGTTAQEADMRELLVKWKRDAKMMALFDVNRDGRIDEREWEAARTMARSQALRDSASAPLPADVNVLSATVDRRPFLLSGIPQQQLIRRERRRAFVSLALGIAAGAVCVLALELRGVI